MKRGLTTGRLTVDIRAIQQRLLDLRQNPSAGSAQQLLIHIPLPVFD